LSLSRVVAVVLVAGLVVAGCGRRGAPILPEAAAEQEAARSNNLYTALPKAQSAEQLPKPKRDFPLDPLL
jgi:predicted small lipoprotein YifL